MALARIVVASKGRLGPQLYSSIRQLATLDRTRLQRAPSGRRTIATETVKNGQSHERIPPSNSSASTQPTNSTDATDGNHWEDGEKLGHVEEYSDLPDPSFGLNQHIPLNEEFKNTLKSVLWQIRSPIRYAFAYGSGVFPQSAPTGRVPTAEEIKAIHPNAPSAVQKTQNGTPKMIDFIFGVSHTQHFHSLNMRYNRHHYSGLSKLGSAAVSRVQDRWGAGVYFHPYVVVNGILIKYGVVNIDTLEKDLTEWDTLYLAGRLHKPVKILRDDAKIRYANQINLIAALRTALLLLPAKFDEMDLYRTIAGISYLGDPRMSLPTENQGKVNNIVDNNLANFRRLYSPLVDTLPNITYRGPHPWAKSGDDWVWTEPPRELAQDMDPVKRGNMVRRLPKAFRSRLYSEYQKKLAVPREEFDRMMTESKAEDTTSFGRREGGGFEQRIAQDDPEELRQYMRTVIRRTVGWPSTTQSLKSMLTAGIPRSIRYLREKFDKWRDGRGKKGRPDEDGGPAATQNRAENRSEEGEGMK